MPEKITNYLKQGLPSKIYLLSFIEPQSGYKLAMKIYGRPTTDKIYKWTKLMEKEGYLEHDKKTKKFNARIQPLALEMGKELETRGLSFNDQEMRLLHRLLDSTNIRKLFEPYFNRERNLNTVNLTCLTYSMIAGIVLIMRKYTSKSPSDFPSIGKLLAIKGDLPETASLGPEHLSRLKSSLSMFQDNRASLGLDNKLDNLRIDAIEKLFDARLGVFFNLPDSFLQKLLRLSKIGENMAESISVAFTVANLGPFISSLVEQEVKKYNAEKSGKK